MAGCHCRSARRDIWKRVYGTPQGKAVGSALPRLGITSFEAVRQGKCFHLSVDGPVTDELLDQARKAAEEVLSNPIIEDVVRVEAIDEADARYAGGVQ